MPLHRSHAPRNHDRTPFRTVRSAFLSVAAVFALAAAAFAPVGPAQAAATKTTCKPPKYPGSGYFTSLTVTGTSCAQGSKLAIAHYRCRTKKSKTGRCAGTVLGYKCTDVRKSIPTEIDGRVACKKSRATVVHTYQQDT